MIKVKVRGRYHTPSQILKKADSKLFSGNIFKLVKKKKEFRVFQNELSSDVKSREFIHSIEGGKNSYNLWWLSGLKKPAMNNSLIEGEALLHGFETIRYSPRIFVGRKCGKEILFEWTTGVSPSHACRIMSTKKTLAKKILENAGVPVPRGAEFSLSDLSGAKEFLAKNPGTYVVKPSVGTGGLGVATGVSSVDQLQWAWKQIKSNRKIVKRNDGYVIVEEQIFGDDYRFLVVGDEVLSVIRRVPAHVIGDGQSTVEKLIIKRNKEAMKSGFLGSKDVRLNEPTSQRLQSQGLDFNSIPKDNQIVFLSFASNIALGADSMNVVSETDPSLLRAAVSSVKAFPGLLQGGVDFIIEDHRIPLESQHAAICEVNTSPAITSPHFPVYGEPRNVAKRIIIENSASAGIPLEASGHSLVHCLEMELQGNFSRFSIESLIEKLQSEFAVNLSTKKISHGYLLLTASGDSNILPNLPSITFSAAKGNEISVIKSRAI